MLPLDSPTWATLKHGYGSAAQDTSAPSGWSAQSGFHNYHEIPNVIHCLRLLEAEPQRRPSSDWEPWGTMVSSLCHQGTIYSASFAAVPHILDIGLRAALRQEIDVGFFLLPTLIEQSRLEGQQPETHGEIFSDYMAAIPRIHELAHAVRSHSWPAEYAAVVGAALAVAKGHLQLSKCLLELGDSRTISAFFEWLYQR
jgi:hypothetical protein